MKWFGVVAWIEETLKNESHTQWILFIKKHDILLWHMIIDVSLKTAKA